MKLLAGIVTYNPQVQRLLMNVNSIINQVDHLLIIDNSSTNSEQFIDTLIENRKISIVFNDSNLGIAKAYNQIAEYCIDQYYDWFLLLDQDSIAPSNLISEFSKYYDYVDVALICPRIVDINLGSQDKTNHNRYESIEKTTRAISSGSLIKTDAYKVIGKFDEIMFIDMVDFDFCQRLIKSKFNLIRVNSVELLHEIGKSTLHKFNKNVFVIHNHSPIRKFYISQNIIYYSTKHGGFKGFLLGIKRAIIFALKTIIYEDKKAKKSYMIIKGMIKGIRISIRHMILVS